jgi:hypothetical protein
MNGTEKLQIVAKTIRELARLPECASRRDEMVRLSEHFEMLAVTPAIGQPYVFLDA